MLAALLVVAGLYGAAVVGAPAASQSGSPAGEALVAPDGTNSYVWPYTSQSRSTAGRTLAVNVIVRGNPDRVRRGFVDRSATNWTTVDKNNTVDASPWRPAHGSARYTYVAGSRTGTGQWVASEYQLAVGTYFGDRTHIRAYPSAPGNWTALQAHTEYWDWFRLRHTVTGVGTGAAFVKQDMEDKPFVANVSTTSRGSTDSDRSWVIVEFVSAAALIAVASRRVSLREIALAGALLGVVLGVRAWGLAAETVLPGVTPKLFVVIGYPVLAIGPPLLVFMLARDRPPLRLSAIAFSGLAVAAVVDLSVVGVAAIPTRIIYHRLALAATLGVVAFGTAREERQIMGIGLAAWAAALLAPLFGLV